VSCVAGIDGAPGGWAVVIMEGGQSSIKKIANLSDLIDSIPQFDIIAIDVPIGLLDWYQVGGRECDRLQEDVSVKPVVAAFFRLPSAAYWKRLTCLLFP
jgi:predicted RNase H-like nuclease